MAKPKLIVVSGVSGAGKTSALTFFEERGYRIVMDLPNELFEPFVEMMVKNPKIYGKTAISLSIFDFLEVTSAARLDTRISLTCIGLTASREELRKRYRLTRHTHPMEALTNTSLEACLNYDELEFQKARDGFDAVVDTTGLTIGELKERMSELTGESGTRIVFESFGYQYGLPLDADVVVDCRLVRNPYWVESLRNHSGLDLDVKTYIEEDPNTEILYNSAYQQALLAYRAAEKEGRHLVVFALGCSGGQHRSVYFANRLAHAFDKGTARAYHREERHHGGYGGK